VVRYDIEGAYQHYQPGDWFLANNQEIRELFGRGMIDSTPQVLRDEFGLQGAGVLAIGDAAPLPGLDAYGIAFERSAKLALPWTLTVLWTPGAHLTTTGAAFGLTRITAGGADIAWEMSVALQSDTRLAGDVGSQQERDKTLALLGDLRLPLYDTGVLWARKTPTTEEVIQLWQEELDAGADPTHAFLRVIYTHPLLMCTLPADWIGQWSWV
jgi:hypothetical protein